jgi:hypothetical protein
MENSIELTTTHNVPKKKKKLKENLIKSVDFPYKAQQIFGLGGKKDEKK